MHRKIEGSRLALQGASRPFVVSFDKAEPHPLSLVGGKARNLERLLAMSLPVPGGFCVTTNAYAEAAASADYESLIAALGMADPSDSGRLTSLAAGIRQAIIDMPVAAEVAEEIGTAYAELGAGEPIAVAVRSSATAEDLSSASFAGQQDTFLNVAGPEAVIEAVRKCWASLWSDRAVVYRAGQGIDQRTVRLAVVVQRLVVPVTAGVIFTANPLTGSRRQSVVDASVGLGELLVSGAVMPDHFVVDTARGEVTEERIGSKEIVLKILEGGGTEKVRRHASGETACLSRSQVAALARLGAGIARGFGAPQDIEWAIDAAQVIWVVQSRPITTLFPLPDRAPDSDDDLRAYYSVNASQGMERPFTPLGMALFRLVTSSITTFFGFPQRHPLDGPRFLTSAGGRLFIDITKALRNKIGRSIVTGMIGVAEARAGEAVKTLSDDPRFSIRSVSAFSFFRRGLSFLLRSRLLLYIPQAVVSPASARRRILGLRATFEASVKLPVRSTGAVDASRSLPAPEMLTAVERLEAIQRLFSGTMPRLLLGIMPAILLPGMALVSLARRLLGDLATEADMETALRALPHNPTTAMDLDLWRLSAMARGHEEAVRAIASRAAQADHRLGAEGSFWEASLPEPFREALTSFLETYGHRCAAELDGGLPRWREDPRPLFSIMANYLRHNGISPVEIFYRGEAEARAMVDSLVARARTRGRLRARLVGWSLGRARALLGLREMPRFYIALLLGLARRMLRPVGEQCVREGSLERAEDLSFLALGEAREAIAGVDFTSLVRERRSDYERESRRRHAPAVLLSDGSEPEGQSGAEAAGASGTLRGVAASKGRVKGRARVVLDPAGAVLEPGEILVAPSTDPGWTPLFLTAAALVMDTGGPMAHGAIVAREYGIPAVVAATGATERIVNGQEITVDGTRGVVEMG